MGERRVYGMIPEYVPKSDKYTPGMESNKDAGVFCFLCVFTVGWVDDESVASGVRFPPVQKCQICSSWWGMS